MTEINFLIRPLRSYIAIKDPTWVDISLCAMAVSVMTNRKEKGLEPSSALNQVDNQDDDGNYEQ